MKSVRLVLAFLCLAPLGATGCFALFSLDEYGPPGPDASVDASTDRDATDADATARPDTAPPQDRRPTKRVFVTSADFNGVLGGTSEADSKCQLLASGAGMGNNFKAWLSVDGQNVRRRFFPSEAANADAGLPDVRIVDTAGRTVAQSWSSLFSTRKLLVPIEHNERGVKVAGGDGGAFAACGALPVIPVWTNSTIEGETASTTDDCTDFTTNNGEARIGISSTEATWTNACVVACTARAHLYCFEQ